MILGKFWYLLKMIVFMFFLVLVAVLLWDQEICILELTGIQEGLNNFFIRPEANDTGCKTRPRHLQPQLDYHENHFPTSNFIHLVPKAS